MGTSLNGLTPAGTYPGLIKTGDNAPIDGTLKTLSDGNGNNLPMAVSTTAVNFTNQLQQSGVAVPTASQVAAKQDTLVSGTNIKTINGASLLGSGDIPVVTSPSGVAGAIQFSNGSAFASDAANLFWDDTNNRLGVGTNTPSSALEVASDAKINGLTVGLGGGAASGCTAFGGSALLDNLTGTNNTAIGKSALENNTASNNTAVGYEAAFSNTSGTGITAIGYQALRTSTGSSNTAVGFEAFLGGSGSFSVAIGTEALRNGAFNAVAIGRRSQRNTTGDGNTSVGANSLGSNTVGLNNSALGYDTQSGNFNGSVILGVQATATSNNQFVVGSSVVNAGAVTTETITADTTWTVRINGANYKIPMLAI